MDMMLPAESPAALARYGNLLFRERPVHDGDLFSRRHPRMSRLNRAKLFAPFAALSGFDEAVRAKDVPYVPRRILDDEELRRLDAALRRLFLATRTGPLARRSRVVARVEYFVVCADADSDAFGRLGLYRAETGVVRSVDPVNQVLEIDGRRIPFSDISAIAAGNDLASGNRHPADAV